MTKEQKEIIVDITEYPKNYLPCDMPQAEYDSIIDALKSLLAEVDELKQEVKDRADCEQSLSKMVCELTKGEK